MVVQKKYFRGNRVYNTQVITGDRGCKAQRKFLFTNPVKPALKTFPSVIIFLWQWFCLSEIKHTQNEKI